MLQTPEEIKALQIKGLEQAMDVYDWRYLNGHAPEEMTEWDVLLTGGKVIRILVPLHEAARIEQAADRYGDNTLFMIGAPGKWS